MQIRVCSRCGVPKLLCAENFNSAHTSDPDADQFHTICKKCWAEIHILRDACADDLIQVYSSGMTKPLRRTGVRRIPEKQAGLWTVIFDEYLDKVGKSQYKSGRTIRRQRIKIIGGRPVVSYRAGLRGKFSEEPTGEKVRYNPEQRKAYHRLHGSLVNSVEAIIEDALGSDSCENARPDLIIHPLGIIGEGKILDPSRPLASIRPILGQIQEYRETHGRVDPRIRKYKGCAILNADPGSITVRRTVLDLVEYIERPFALGGLELFVIWPTLDGRHLVGGPKTAAAFPYLISVSPNSCVSSPLATVTSVNTLKATQTPPQVSTPVS